MTQFKLTRCRFQPAHVSYLGASCASVRQGALAMAQGHPMSRILANATYHSVVFVARMIMCCRTSSHSRP